jgi:hypothetical protein
MLKRIFPPYIMMDLVYPDTGNIMHERFFPGHDIYVIAGFLYNRLGYYCVYTRVLPCLLFLFCPGYLCNKVESGLKTHRPTRGFVQLSLSEII